MTSERVFIAGATGMVGTAIMQELLVNRPRLRLRAVQHATAPLVQSSAIEYQTGDLSNLEFCQQVLKDCDYMIMAAAAYAGGAASFAHSPWEQVFDNVHLYANLLQALQQSNVKRAIWIGSITLYQEFQGHIQENELDLNAPPPTAHFGAGWVTRFFEQLCQGIRGRELEIINVRLANVFGPYARFDLKRSNFIPAIIRKATDALDPFEVWGAPEITREVLYSADCGRAIRLLLDANSIKQGVFNVGGLQTTVQDVVECALLVAQHNPQKVIYQSNRPTTLTFRALDCSKIKSALGWEPAYSLADGIDATTQWWLANKNSWTK